MHRGGGSGGAGGAQAPPTAVISMKPPLSPSYKFEKEEGGEGLEEEEWEVAPPVVIPGSATAYGTTIVNNLIILNSLK